MSARSSWRHRVAVAAVAASALAGCDLGGPSGPVQISGTVTGEPRLGAAVVEVTWKGVTGFAGRGDTRVYSAAVPEGADRHRLILVRAAGGDLGFTIALEDARLEAPTVTVVAAAGTDDRPMPAGSLRVVLER